MRFPSTIYTAYISADDGVIVCPTDSHFTFNDAIDAAVSTGWGDVEFRIFRTDFDVKTNAFESGSEVTEEAISIIKQRLLERGLGLPDWLAEAA